MRKMHRALTGAVFFCFCLATITCAPQGIQSVRAERTSADHVEVGISFSQIRATSLGLDYQSAYQELLGMKFSVVRLSTYWKNDEAENFEKLDWLVSESEKAGQPVILSVGMKGLGWPEYYIPDYLVQLGWGWKEDLGNKQELDDRALAFIHQVVERYKGNQAIKAWQVENEPLNFAGPKDWHINIKFLAKEVGLVKGIDSRPVMINSFAHFNRLLDYGSRGNLAEQLGFDIGSMEKDSLSILGKGDMLGLDVYTRVAFRDVFGQNQVATADGDWGDRAGYLGGIAQKRGNEAWVTELQAEPWANSREQAEMKSNLHPEMLLQETKELKTQGFSHILMWGAEYWLWARDHGDSSWLLTVMGIQGSINLDDFESRQIGTLSV